MYSRRIPFCAWPWLTPKGTPNPDEFFDDTEGVQAASHPALEQRVSALEQELAEFKEAFDKLMKELLG